MILNFWKIDRNDSAYKSRLHRLRKKQQTDHTLALKSDAQLQRMAARPSKRKSKGNSLTAKIQTMNRHQAIEKAAAGLYFFAEVFAYYLIYRLTSTALAEQLASQIFSDITTADARSFQTACRAFFVILEMCALFGLGTALKDFASGSKGAKGKLFLIFAAVGIISNITFAAMHNFSKDENAIEKIKKFDTERTQLVLKEDETKDKKNATYSRYLSMKWQGARNTEECENANPSTGLEMPDDCKMRSGKSVIAAKEQYDTSKGKWETASKNLDEHKAMARPIEPPKESYRWKTLGLVIAVWLTLLYAKYLRIRYLS